MILKLGKLWFSKLICQLIIKVWSTFQRSWVWAKPTNTFHLRNLTIAKQLAVWRLERNGESQCESNKRKHT